MKVSFQFSKANQISPLFDDFFLQFLGGTTHGTNSTEMAARLHFEDRSSRITPHNAHERKHEIDSTSRRKCLLNEKGHKEDKMIDWRWKRKTKQLCNFPREKNKTIHRASTFKRKSSVNTVSEHGNKSLISTFVSYVIFESFLWTQNCYNKRWK